MQVIYNYLYIIISIQLSICKAYKAGPDVYSYLYIYMAYKAGPARRVNTRRKQITEV